MHPFLINSRVIVLYRGKEKIRSEIELIII